MLENCQLLVIFNDGEQKLFNDVEVYGHQGDSDVFWFEKDNRRCFFPISQVKYFGASQLYNDESVVRSTTIHIAKQWWIIWKVLNICYPLMKKKLILISMKPKKKLLCLLIMLLLYAKCNHTDEQSSSDWKMLWKNTQRLILWKIIQMVLVNLSFRRT